MMTTNESAGLTNNAWMRRIEQLRQDMENVYSSNMADSYTEAAEYLLSADCETEYDQDDAAFLRRDASRMDSK